MWYFELALGQGWPKYDPWGVGCIQLANQFNLAYQIPYTFFSSTTFPTMDSDVTASGAACHVNHTVSDPPVAKQS